MGDTLLIGGALLPGGSFWTGQNTPFLQAKYSENEVYWIAYNSKEISE